MAIFLSNNPYQQQAPEGEVVGMPFWRQLRAIALGLLVVLPVNLYFLMYMEIGGVAGGNIKSTGPFPSTISLFANCIFILFVFTVFNEIVRRIVPRVALDRAELLIIYLMQVIATSIVSIDFLDVLVPMMCYPDFYATPENQWKTNLLPYLKPWLTVRDPAAVQAFWEGNSDPLEIRNLAPWLTPVACWSGCIFVMLFVFFCINTIVRQQWFEHDRLQFPIVELPMQITEPGHRLIKSKLMWAGFAVAGLISINNGLQIYFPLLPYVPTRMWSINQYFQTKPWNAMGWTPISFYPYAIGLGFLLPLDMLFSCWFFFILWRVIKVVGNMYGVFETTPNFPYMDQQALGAYLFIGISALWSGRRHLAAVAKTAIRGDRRAGESDGPMSYRTAIAGALIGTPALMGFFAAAGLGWWLAVIAITLYMALAFAINRMHAEFGPPAHDLHAIGPEIVILNAVGAPAFSQGQVAALGWFWWFNRAYRSIPIAYQLDGIKIAQRGRIPQRTTALAIALASAGAVLLGFFFFIVFAYTIGAGVGMPIHVRVFGHEAWMIRYTSWITAPRQSDLPATAAIVVGSFAALALQICKMNISWWPLHPLGFAVSTSYSIGTLWMPLFIAWTAKLITLKVGGLKTYKVALDFFLGLILGDFIVGTLWPVFGWLAKLPSYSFMQ